MHDPAQVDRVLLRRYLAYLTTRRYARATVARKAAALRAVLRLVPGATGSVPRTRPGGCRRPRPRGRLPTVSAEGELGALSSLPPPRRGPDPGPSRSPWRLGTGPSLELLYAPACGWPSCAASTVAGVDLGRPHGHGDRARATKERRVPDPRALRRGPRAVAGRRRAGAGREPDSPAEARVLEPPGPPARTPRRAAHPRPALAGAHPPPRPAPHLRHPPARRRGRPAGGPGAARPRQPADDPGLHPREQGAAAQPSTRRPTPGPERSRAALVAPRTGATSLSRAHRPVGDPTAIGTDETRTRARPRSPIRGAAPGEDQPTGGAAYGRRHDEAAVGRGRPLRAPDPPVEPQDAPVHPRRAQRDLPDRPAPDHEGHRGRPTAYIRDLVGRRRHHPLRRHQEADPGPGGRSTPRPAACPTSTSAGWAAC